MAEKATIIRDILIVLMFPNQTKTVAVIRMENEFRRINTKFVCDEGINAIWLKETESLVLSFFKSVGHKNHTQKFFVSFKTRWFVH